MVTILIFGQLKEIVGTSQLQGMEVSDTDSLRHQLIQRYPALESMQFTMSVDRKMVVENVSLNLHSEVALLPPYSGG